MNRKMPRPGLHGRLLLAPMSGAILFVALALAVGILSTAGTQAALPPTSRAPFAPQATPTSCSSGAWTAQAAYPTPIADNTAASVGGFVYNFGGTINNASTALAYKYDPATNAWTSIAPLPAARSQASAVSDGTYIYILGGSDQSYSPTSTIWRYDPSTNTYNTSLASYTIPTYGQAAAYLNGKIYRIAGASTGSDYHVEVYNIATNSWSMAANYPFANHDLVAVGLGSYVYAGGGNASPDKTWRYDPSTDTWDDASVPDFPAGRQGSATAVYNGRWVLAGGDVNFATSTNVIAWSPGDGGWTTLPDMLQARSYMGGASTGSAIYVTGGWSSPGTPSTDNQRYVEASCATSTATPTSTPQASATPTAGCTTGWNIVPSPNVGPVDSRLFGVAAVAPDDVWAVGWSSDGSNQQTLTEHWNGTQWAVVPSPSLGPVFNELLGVAAVASNDVWAVGWHSTLEHTLVEHWDGTQWSIVPSADPLSYNILSGVLALAANDIWADGWSGNGSIHQTLVEHWDGSTWSAVPSPNAGTTDDRLFGVAAIASNDVWAVGWSNNGTVIQTLTEHWNGTQWSIVPSPNQGTSDNYLSAAAAVGSNDVWAVDRYGPAGGWQTLTEHWNGTQWSIVSSPSGGTPSVLDGVAAIASDDVWAVGGWYQTLALHWDGTQWSVVPSPNPASNAILQGVAALSSTNLWSVGYSYDSNSSHTLIEHYTGLCASPTPSPTSGVPTSTRTPTLTPTPAQTSVQTPTSSATVTPPATVAGTGTPQPTQSTASPTATQPAPATVTLAPSVTPTTCTITFTDVPPGSTFYPYVHCLACLGIINGYPDGTFKPNANVTRGQLSKIVSNSAGFSDTPTGQQFQDVPSSGPGSTFYVYIFRLVHRGYINGYPCGSVPSEPCVPPANLPYFRPNANATRGQISKIDANAAGFSDPPSGQQFQDVPVGSTFYTYTYRLVSRGVMSGYPCGGAGEPCVPPGNLPYFRPNNNATRGQTSKIVSNTFFPDCSP